MGQRRNKASRQVSGHNANNQTCRNTTIHLSDRHVAGLLAAGAAVVFVPHAVAACGTEFLKLRQLPAVNLNTSVRQVGLGSGSHVEKVGNLRASGRLAFPITVAVGIARVLGVECPAVFHVAAVRFVVPPAPQRGVVAPACRQVGDAWLWRGYAPAVSTTAIATATAPTPFWPAKRRECKWS